jgi:UPF0716 protein FxsA
MAAASWPLCKPRRAVALGWVGDYRREVGPLFLAFASLPFLELFVLVRIGRQIGALNTVAFLIATGLIGAFVAKTQGRRVIAAWREALQQGRVPEEGVLDGVLVLVGALLLIMPGVITDVLGLLCLLPFTRRPIGTRVQKYLRTRVATGALHMHQVGFPFPPGVERGPRPPGPSPRGDVIDTEGEDITERDRQQLP